MPSKLFRSVFVGSLMLCAHCSTAAETTPARDEAKISFSLVVDAPVKLRSLLQNGLDISRWQDYDAMTLPLLESLVRDARAQALEAVATEGYFNAGVDMAIESLPANRYTVRLQVKPGEPARVSSVSLKLSGLDDVDADQRVRQQWPLVPGSIFRQSDWESAKQGAVANLAQRRYIGATVAESKATVDPAANTAALALVLDPGPPYFYGPVTVSGLSRYPPFTVTHLAPFRPGAPYAREDVEIFLRRLNATNYFASAQVIIDDNRETARAAPVRVSVIEAPTRRLEGGIGYSTDTLYRATGAWRDVDLFNAAWRLRSELRLESKLQQFGTTLDLPARSDGWADGFDVAATRTDIQNLVTQGAVIGVTRRSIDERRQPAFGASYYFEQQRPADAPSDFVRALFVRYEYTRRTTDDIVFPRSGAMAALRLGVGIPWLSTERFGRAVGQLAWFRPLGRQDDIALRAEAGAVFARSSQGIPQALLFGTGGDTTVRGYAYDSLGVKNGSATVGGRYYALASAEYTHWFADSWGVATFVDTGSAVDDPRDFSLATGYGIGARVRSPIGPFRMDLARGDKTGKFRVHVSVGLAF